MGRLFSVWIAVWFFGLASASGARAASFDCARAKTPRETLICQTPALSLYDEQLAQAYQAALIRLPANAAAPLKEQQRKWLNFLGQACPPGKYRIERCLERAYNARLDDLSRTGMKIGPYMFGRVDLYAAKAARPVEGYTPAVKDHSSYPQILSPDNTQTAAWNASVSAGFSSFGKSIGGDEGSCDGSVGYEIKLATSSVIGVLWTDSEYCHGAAHGYGGSHNDNRVFAPALRPLAPSDLFRQSGPWKDRLTQLFLAKVKAALAKDNLGATLPSGPEVSNFVGDPKNWNLGSDSLTFAPGSYEFGQGHIPLQAITIRWAELKDVLSPTAVVH